jgi:predicted  nucleic acid-binding Zn-ribbon protein
MSETNSLGVIQQVLKQLDDANKRNQELLEQIKILNDRVIELSNNRNDKQTDITQSLSNIKAKIENAQELSEDVDSKVKDAANLVIVYSKQVGFK